MAEITGVAPFPRFVDLRAAHNDLLRRYRAEGSTPSLLEAVREFLRRAQLTGALLDAESDRWTAQGLLDYWVATLDRSGITEVAAQLDEFDPALAPVLPDEACPYVGLNAFDEERHPFYFGRRRVVEQLVQLLAQGRLLAVVGPSGSGKSSLVRAGLIPELRAGAIPGSAGWAYLPPIVPGSAPLASLERALADAPADGTTLVLTVDQFEEAFTLGDDDQEHRAFLDRLVELAAGPGSHRVVLTMRSDFEQAVTRAEALYPLFERAKFVVPPLAAAELREAIEGPAAAVGLRFEAGVVDALLQDVLGEPAALPLLQFTLLRLWEQRERNRVTMASYQRSGGGRLALARAADALYTSLIPEEQVTARRILTRLVRPGYGLEVTSNRVRYGDLLQLGEDPGRVERVLRKLIGARLVRETSGEHFGDTQVEVAHEALVRNWPTLVDWLEDERDAQRQRHRLAAAADQWANFGRDPGALLRGAPLAQAEEYPDLSPLEQEFVAASRAAAEREREAEVARQIELARVQAHAEAERQRAEDQLRASRRLRRALLALGLLFLLSLGALGFGFYQYQAVLTARAQVEQQRQIAVARQLTAQSLTLAESEPDLSLLLSLEAGQITDTLELRRSLFTGLAAGGPLVRYLRAHVGEINDMAFSGDGSRLVTASNDGGIVAWRLPEGVSTTPLLGLKIGPAYHLAMSDDGRRLVTAHNDKLVLWDLETGKTIETIETGDIVAAMAMSADNERVATAHCAVSETSEICAHTGLRLWDARMHPAGELEGSHTAQVFALQFSPDGRSLASAGADATVVLWDLADRRPRFDPLEGHTDTVYTLAFSPDGARLASGGRDSAIMFWRTRDGLAEGRPLRRHGDSVTDLAWSRDGGTLFSTSLDRSVIMWDAETLQELDLLNVHQAETMQLALSPDGRWLATGDRDGVVILWDAQRRPTMARAFARQSGAPSAAIARSPDGRTIAVAGNGTQIALYDSVSRRLLGRLGGSHTGTVSALAYSPDGRQLVSGGLDGRVVIWDLASAGELDHFDVHAGVYALGYSPDGKLFASAGNTGDLILWPADRPDQRRQLPGHQGVIWSVAFSPDGRLLASGGEDKTVRLWDVAAGRASGPPLTGHTEPIYAVAFSPDGTLASGGKDLLIRLWDPATGRSRGEPLAGHADSILALAFSADGARLASADIAQGLRLWDVAQQAAVGDPLSGHAGAIQGVAFADADRRLLSVSEDGTVRVWDTRSHAPLDPPIVWAAASITTMALNHSGTTLVTGSESGQIGIWDPQTGALRGREGGHLDGWVKGLAFSPDDQFLAAADSSGQVKVWDLEDGGRQVFRAHFEEGAISALLFSPSGAYLAAGAGSTLRVWKTEDWTDHTGLSIRAGTVASLAISPGGDLLAIGASTGQVIVWNLNTLEPPYDFYSTDRSVNALAFNPTGTILALASDDGSVTLWDTARRQRKGLPLRSSSRYIASVAISPDGAILAAGGGDGRIDLWDLERGRRLAPQLVAHKGDVTGLTFRPDGALLSAGDDAEILAWDFSVGALREWACRLSARSLRWEEWERYLPGEPYHQTCPAEQLQLAELIAQGDTFAQAGDSARAAELFAQAAGLVAGSEIAILNNQACWFGAIADQAAEVIGACNRGVDVAGDDLVGVIRDSRGVARALLGDYKGAVEDFEAYLAWAQRFDTTHYDRFGEKRKRWIEQLRQAENPFTPEELANLRTE